MDFQIPIWLIKISPTSVANSIQAQGQGINIYVGSNTARGHYKAWVDWDNNGIFNNATELVYDSGGVSNSYNNIWICHTSYSTNR